MIFVRASERYGLGFLSMSRRGVQAIDLLLRAARVVYFTACIYTCAKAISTCNSPIPSPKSRYLSTPIHHHLI